MSDPRVQGLTYFTELQAADLNALFARPGLLSLLQRCGASISMAMLDLSDTRRRVLAALNQRGIPVTAWLVLEPDEGYWLTADNADLGHRRYLRVRDWAWQAGLELEAVGLDIEIPLDDSVALLEQRARALWRLFRGRRSRQALEQARSRYAALLEQIHADGFRSETYQYFVILDDRLARSTLLQRVLGIVDLAPDREVLMLYRSLLPDPLGELLVEVFGAEAQGIAVGITGGGVDALQAFFQRRELDLPQLLCELRRARRHCRRLYVFSLEGCEEGGYLEALCEADLATAPPPLRLAHAAAPARAMLRAALRAEGWWDRVRGRGE